jgi:ADP-heptose:LPS heptosyltransferase
MANQVKSLMKKESTLSPKTTIKESIALYKRANLFIGADTGPLHIAAAIGIATIAIFGPSLPERNGPWGDNHEIVYYHLHCSNCYKRNCDSLMCMKNITVDEVLARVNSKLLDLPLSNR